MLESYIEDLKYKHSQMIVTPHTDQRMLIILFMNLFSELKSDVDLIMVAFKNLSQATTNQLKGILHIVHALYLFLFLIEMNSETLTLLADSSVLQDSVCIRIRQTQVCD
jgi:hypothetical protein